MKKSEVFKPKFRFKKCNCGYCGFYGFFKGEIVSVREIHRDTHFIPNKVASTTFHPWISFKCFEKV